MAKMIDVTLVGDIVGQPSTDTVISINEDEIFETNDDATGNSSTRIKMKNTRFYFVKETKQELINKIDS